MTVAVAGHVPRRDVRASAAVHHRSRLHNRIVAAQPLPYPDQRDDHANHDHGRPKGAAGVRSGQEQSETDVREQDDGREPLGDMERATLERGDRGRGDGNTHTARSSAVGRKPRGRAAWEIAKRRPTRMPIPKPSLGMSGPQVYGSAMAESPTTRATPGRLSPRRRALRSPEGPPAIRTNPCDRGRRRGRLLRPRRRERPACHRRRCAAQ